MTRWRIQRRDGNLRRPIRFQVGPPSIPYTARPAPIARFYAALRPGLLRDFLTTPGVAATKPSYLSQARPKPGGGTTFPAMPQGSLPYIPYSFVKLCQSVSPLQVAGFGAPATLAAQGGRRVRGRTEGRPRVGLSENTNTELEHRVERRWVGDCARSAPARRPRIGGSTARSAACVVGARWSKPTHKRLS